MSLAANYLKSCPHGWRRALSSLVTQRCSLAWTLFKRDFRNIEMERSPPTRLLINCDDYPQRVSGWGYVGITGYLLVLLNILDTHIARILSNARIQTSFSLNIDISNPTTRDLDFFFLPQLPNSLRREKGKQEDSTQLCRWTTAMRSPALARLQSRAVSGLTTSSVRVQPQNFLARRCASTAALRGPVTGPAYQTLWERQLKQRRHASSTTAAAVYVL